MDFAARLRDVPGRKGPSCTVATVLAALDAEDRGELEAALADPQIPSTHIARVLAADGHDIRSSTVQRHCRGDCDC